MCLRWVSYGVVICMCSFVQIAIAQGREVLPKAIVLMGAEDWSAPDERSRGFGTYVTSTFLANVAEYFRQKGVLTETYLSRDPHERPLDALRRLLTKRAFDGVIQAYITRIGGQELYLNITYLTLETKVSDGGQLFTTRAGHEKRVLLASARGFEPLSVSDIAYQFSVEVERKVFRR